MVRCLIETNKSLKGYRKEIGSFSPSSLSSTRGHRCHRKKREIRRSNRNNRNFSGRLFNGKQSSQVENWRWWSGLKWQMPRTNCLGVSNCRSQADVLFRIKFTASGCWRLWQQRDLWVSFCLRPSAKDQGITWVVVLVVVVAVLVLHLVHFLSIRN